MNYTIATHAVAGTAALLLGLVALASAKRRGRHTQAGRWYAGLLLYVTIGGLVIGAADPALSPFEIAVAPTLGPLLLGIYAVRVKGRMLGRHWLTWHIGGMGGSFIGVVTAGLFQTVAPLLPTTGLVIGLLFAVPAIAGTVWINAAVERRVPAAARPVGA